MDLSQPRISANELGSFVFSSEVVQKRILRGQKYPKPGIVARYQAASTAILRSLKGNVFSEECLKAELQKLKEKAVLNEWQARVRRSNIQAVRRFIPIAEKASLPEGEHSIIRKNASFELEGVLISVRPDVLTWNSGAKFFTYSKLRFSNQKYAADASEIVLLLIQKFAEGQKIDGLGFDSSRARLIDCCSQQIFEAHGVSQFKRSMLVKALKDIKSLWPFISEN